MGMGIPKSDLLDVTMAVILVVGQRFLSILEAICLIVVYEGADVEMDINVPVEDVPVEDVPVWT